MSFLFRGQWSPDKILSIILVFIILVLFPVWAEINDSVSYVETTELLINLFMKVFFCLLLSEKKEEGEREKMRQ